MQIKNSLSNLTDIEGLVNQTSQHINKAKELLEKAKDAKYVTNGRPRFPQTIVSAVWKSREVSWCFIKPQNTFHLPLWLRLRGSLEIHAHQYTGGSDYLTKYSLLISSKQSHTRCSTGVNFGPKALLRIHFLAQGKAVAFLISLWGESHSLGASTKKAQSP